MIQKTFYLLFLALMTPVIATAYDFEVDGIYYNINGNEATVTNRSSSDNSYNGNVIIPTLVTYGNTTYTVTSIDHQAFLNCPNLTGVTIPISVTSISTNAFGGCSGLTNIIVTTGNPFYDSRNNCNAIIETSTNSLISGCKNTIIPNSVSCIGECAFNCCNSMDSIFIPNSVTSIGDSAFYECKYLDSIDLSNVTSIGSYAFYRCFCLNSVELNDSLTEIKDSDEIETSKNRVLN